MKKIVKNTLVMTVAAAIAAGCITASAAPRVKVAQSEATPVLSTAANVVTVQVKASDFATVAGEDLTITVGEGATLQGVTAVSGITLVSGQNYILNGNTARIIDVHNLEGIASVPNYVVALSIAVPDVFAGYDITINGLLVDTSEEETGTLKAGKLVVGMRDETANVSSASTNLDTEEGFVPYGGVVNTANSQYLDKLSDGSFDTDGVSTVAYRRFKNPATGKPLTTFGVSAKVADETASDPRNQVNGLQFASYIPDYNREATYGTLVISGDLEEFKDYYEDRFDTDDALYAQLAKSAANLSGDHFGKIIFDTNKSISFKIVTQTKILWSGDEAMQYAIRLYNLDQDKVYTAVGFEQVGNTRTFSTEIKISSYNGYFED